MKTLTPTLLSLVFILFLSSCEFDVATGTTVHPDGSLDKTIAIEEKDSAKLLFNTGTWEKSRLKKEGTVPVDSVKPMAKEEAKFFNTFHKKFGSAEEVNADLSVVNDTLLQVTSKFEKKFRWFYTYITYSETYHRLNKMKLNPEDFFTAEDFAFIDRLPAEGQKISKADELYLTLLHNKIFDTYGEKALYDELFDLAFIVVNTPAGIDSLQKHKKDFRETIEKIDDKKNAEENKFLLMALDSFNIPIDSSKLAEFEKSQQNFWKKVGFISVTNDGKFINRINLPWDIVNSNADSVSGNSLIWAPPTIKFLLKDYTMYGECRKLNWWAVLVSVLVVGFTGYLFIRRKN